jgi:pectate lyase
LVVRVSGTIALPTGDSDGMHAVASDKTIVGLGDDASLTGGGLTIGLPVDEDVTSPPPDAVHNVVIRNLSISGATDDLVNVQMFSHHIWIDHNDLAEGYDGLIDIKRGSDYITVSWNHTHDHAKNMPLGHDDDNGAQDIRRLRVTYHHNWYDETPQRNPRVRFGEPVHVYSNYYLNNSDTGPACRVDAGCLIEANCFEDVEEPMTNDYAGRSGDIVERDNHFAGETGPPVVGGQVADPGAFHAYEPHPAAEVKVLVPAGAGTGVVGP